MPPLTKDQALADATRAIRDAFPDRAEEILQAFADCCPRCHGKATLSTLAKSAGIGGATLAVIEELERHPEALNSAVYHAALAGGKLLGNGKKRG